MFVDYPGYLIKNNSDVGKQTWSFQSRIVLSSGGSYNDWTLLECDEIAAKVNRISFLHWDWNLTFAVLEKGASLICKLSETNNDECIIEKNENGVQKEFAKVTWTREGVPPFPEIRSDYEISFSFSVPDPRHPFQSQ